ncbi:MAG: glycosyltransferase, partial [Candidatus Marinimicrobia bacterium]|nr:glycosyltransferase [Candidatus Neomarinimicrobiota bacterium]
MSVSTVSVLIVSYNVKQYLGQAVRALQRSNYGGKIEIIVVDNNSYDGTSDYITHEFPDTILIPNLKNLGFG